MEQKLKRQKKGKNMPEWAFLRERQRVQRDGSEKAPCMYSGKYKSFGMAREDSKNMEGAGSGAKMAGRQAGLVTQRMPGIYPVDWGSQ